MTTDIINVPKMPIRTDLGFPNTVFVTIDSIVYEVFYGFNSEDGELVMAFKRVKDNKDIFIGRITERAIIRVYEPDLGDRLFALFALKIDRDKNDLDIWIFPQSLSTDATLESVLGGTS